MKVQKKSVENLENANVERCRSDLENCAEVAYEIVLGLAVKRSQRSSVSVQRQREREDSNVAVAMVF